MVTRKWEKNIVYETPAHPLHPKDAAPSIELYHVNDKIVKGGFCFTAAWVVKPDPPKDNPMDSHYHKTDEYLFFIGGDPANPRELGAEIEFWIEDEKYTFNKSCAIFIPKGVHHTPVIMHRVDKPFIFGSTLPEPTIMEYHVPAPKSFVSPWKKKG